MTYCKLYIGNQFSVQLITRTRTRTEFIFLANLISKLCFCLITLNYPPAVTVPVAPLASVVSTLCWWQHPPADWALPPPGWTGYDTTERLLSAPPKTSTGWKKRNRNKYYYVFGHNSINTGFGNICHNPQQEVSTHMSPHYTWSRQSSEHPGSLH